MRRTELVQNDAPFVAFL